MEVLGIDIGGTGIKAAIVDTVTGSLVTERYRVETPQPATPEAVVQEVASIVQHFEWNDIIGIGFPAAVVHDVVKTASNIDKRWLGVNAANLIEQITKCPTHLINDVDAAGYAEMSFGAGKGNKGTVIIAAVGTGIGTALFTEGYLFPNTELGFIKVKGIAGEYYAANSVREKEDLSWMDWGQRLNKYLTRLESLFFPDLIILGGGVSKKFEKYEDYIKLECPIVPADMKNNAAIIGAALAAKHQLIDLKS
ncbi:MAG: polyphosphate glucokinase [Cyclobacteriaceae bacterium]|jgi:polyphosphate glucokinase